MVPDTAPRPSMNVVQAVVSPEEDVFTERWRQWRLRNDVTSRIDARRTRIAFTVIFVALGSWLGLQLLAPSLWR